jgi:hypothetical protein
MVTENTENQADVNAENVQAKGEEQIIRDNLGNILDEEEVNSLLENQPKQISETTLKVVVALLSRYINVDHSAFHHSIYQLCLANATVISLPLVKEYGIKLEQEDEIRKWFEKSEYTERKKRADGDRDKSYRSMASFVRVNRKNADPVVSQYAAHIDILLQEKYAKIPGLDYEAETNEIEQMLLQLRSGEYMPAVQALGLSTWLEDLEEKNNTFKTYYQEAYQELGKKPDITLKEARKETDNALITILDRVKGLINLGLEANVLGFVKEYNRHAEHYNTLVREHYGRLHVKTDISLADFEAIPNQTYTGNPIFVIPKVSVKIKSADGNTTVVDLIFSVDFTVSYINNIEPGTARVVVKGIGKYKGRSETIFNIVSSIV